jgi:hypothetical protein
MTLILANSIFTPQRILAVQEQLLGFINTEVIEPTGMHQQRISTVQISRFIKNQNELYF